VYFACRLPVGDIRGLYGLGCCRWGSVSLEAWWRLELGNQDQKDVIQEVLNGRDALVIQPTGSGKSLCFQFPTVHQQKKAVVIVPTISLMEDYFHYLQEKGIPSAYLGSAQTDKGLEDKSFRKTARKKLFLLLWNG